MTHPAIVDLQQLFNCDVTVLRDWDGNDASIFDALNWDQVTHAYFAGMEIESHFDAAPDWLKDDWTRSKLWRICLWARVYTVYLAEQRALSTIDRGQLDAHDYVEHMLTTGDARGTIDRADLIRLATYMLATTGGFIRTDASNPESSVA